MISRQASVLALVALLLAACSFLLLMRREASSDQSLVIHCAAGLHKPVSQLVAEFKRLHDVTVTLNVAGSGVLESQLQLAGGDVYIPADSIYIDRAREKGLVAKSVNLAWLHAVLVTQKSNPKNLYRIEDLYREGVRLSMADESAAIGSFVRGRLSEVSQWEELSKSIVVMKPTVNQVVEDVAIGAVDATIAWDAVARQYDQVAVVELDHFMRQPRTVSAAVLSMSESSLADEFVHYLANENEALEVWRNTGYQLVKTLKEVVDE